MTTFAVVPKTQKYRQGRLYRPFGQKYFSLYSTPTHGLKNRIGIVSQVDFVVFIEETSWCNFKVIHKDQIGWMGCVFLRAVPMKNDE